MFPRHFFVSSATDHLMGRFVGNLGGESGEFDHEGTKAQRRAAVNRGSTTSTAHPAAFSATVNSGISVAFRPAWP